MAAVPTKELQRLAPEEYAAWAGFLHTHASLVRRLDGEMRDGHGLSLSEYEVLLYLGFAPERRLPMSVLAESVLLTPSGITRIVDRLVADGLVCRAGEESDRRRTYACLTDEGCDRLLAAQKTHLDGVRRTCLAHLTEEECNTLAGVWSKLLAS